MLRGGAAKHAAIALAAAASPSLADSGDPVAVRNWGHGVVSIETCWNLCITVAPDLDAVEAVDVMTRPSLLIVGGKERDIPETVAADHVVFEFDRTGNALTESLAIDRQPNQHRVELDRIQAGEKPTSPHVAHVQRTPDHVSIHVDGVSIDCVGNIERLLAGSLVDVIVDVVVAPDADHATQICERFQPRLFVALDGLPSTAGNTVAVSAAQARQSRPTVIILDDQPWPMPAEMAGLFARKEAAARVSAEVFAALSVAQMNHRPSNGTHTPRWNVEHMAGREVGFFTQIFHAVESGFPHIDLNPKQMPDDYVPAHPDWSGAAEARRIEAVQTLVRRYSYLLEGIDLDERAPGSRWTLRRLLEQMERHWGEHTANVQAKFELDDWPAE